MTIAQLVGRERSRLRVALVVRGVAMALAVGFVLLAASTVALGSARWITRPSAPLGAWMLTVAVLAIILWRSWRAGVRGASMQSIADAIERERALRAGSVRGALEVDRTGPLGAMAARRIAGELSRLRRPLAPRLQGRALRWSGGAAVVAVVSFATV